MIGLGLLLLSSCKTPDPEYDQCNLLVEVGSANCVPRNQPGKSEYTQGMFDDPSTEEYDGMTGYQCFSPDSMQSILKAIEDAKAECESNK